jgi:hypothetical protein
MDVVGIKRDVNDNETRPLGLNRDHEDDEPIRRHLDVGRSQDSSVDIVTGYEQDGRGQFSALEPIQPPIQPVLGALSPGVKRHKREADHSTSI